MGLRTPIERSVRSSVNWSTSWSSTIKIRFPKTISQRFVQAKARRLFEPRRIGPRRSGRQASIWGRGFIRDCARPPIAVGGEREQRPWPVCERAYAGVLMPKRILIIDDNSDDALLLEDLLRRKGVANPVRTLANGQVAIDYFEGKKPYDDRSLYPLATLIFLDLGLPGGSGLGLLEWLKEHPEIPRPRVVIYTQQT